MGFLDNGSRLYEAYYASVDTQRIATFIHYFPDGELHSVSVIDGNKLITRYSYYPDGKIQSRHNGFKEVGENWNPDGSRESVVHYSGAIPSRVTKWYANGTMKELSEWNNEQRHGKWYQWDSLGNQTRKEMYINGKLRR